MASNIKEVRWSSSSRSPWSYLGLPEPRESMTDRVERTPLTADMKKEAAVAPSTLFNKKMDTRARMEALMTHADDAAIDEAIDRATKMGNAPEFIAQFQPQSAWLWRQWHGTVLQSTWKPAAVMMLVSVLLIMVMEVARNVGSHTWTLLEVPDPNDGWVARLKGFTTMWGYLLTMATFVNSFFLSQAYGFWLATKGNVRKVQGRLNDMGMLLAVHACRDAETGTFKPESRELLETVARYVRLYHMVRHAHICTTWRSAHAHCRAPPLARGPPLPIAGPV